MARETLMISLLPTPAPTNKHVPTGGVSKPMQRLAIMMMPKWTGSIPREIAIGRKIGVKINTSAADELGVDWSVFHFC